MYSSSTFFSLEGSNWKVQTCQLKRVVCFLHPMELCACVHWRHNLGGVVNHQRKMIHQDFQVLFMEKVSWNWRHVNQACSPFPALILPGHSQLLHYYTAFWFCPALSWGVKLPGNVSSVLLDKAIALDSNPVKLETPVKIPDSGIFARINTRSPVVSKPAGSWRLVDLVKVLTKSE